MTEWITLKYCTLMKIRVIILESLHIVHPLQRPVSDIVLSSAYEMYHPRLVGDIDGRYEEVVGIPFNDDRIDLLEGIYPLEVDEVGMIDIDVVLTIYFLYVLMYEGIGFEETPHVVYVGIPIHYHPYNRRPSRSPTNYRLLSDVQS